jgi:hypothetical protein
VENFPQLDGRKSREIAAEKAGFGNETTYRQARKVTEEAIPELVEAVDKGDIAISTAAKLANMRQGERTDIEHSANLQKVSQSEAAFFQGWPR